jgi:DNA-binding PadR family transcriptional regulator
MAPDMFAELKKGSAETLILALLEDGTHHGYELAKMIDDRTRGKLSFHVANVYTSLYRLTPSGRKQLGVRREHWRAFVGAVDVVLNPA